MIKPVPEHRSRSLRSKVLTGIIGIIISAPALAETLYVTDILRLGLHTNSDTSGEPFRILVSGDALEVLQRTTYYARVRTANGDEGWVKASYLIDEKPAQARLAELTAERDRLASELTTLGDRLADNNSELAQVKSERDTLQQNATAAASEVSTLRAANQSLSEKVAAHKYSVRMRWLVGISVMTLLGGFIAGWWWTDARQRKRHGGFRI